MVITTIKLSQEVNFMGMPTWIGMEAQLLPDDNEKDGLRALQKSITEYLQEEESRMPKKKWSNPNKADNSEAVQNLLDKITACTYIKEDDTGETNLRTYWLISKGNLSLSEAYKAKEKQLTDAK